MLKNYVCTLNLWGGHNIVKETVQANDTNKAKQRAKEAVRKRIKVPNDMVQITNVEIVK